MSQVRIAPPTSADDGWEVWLDIPGDPGGGIIVGMGANREQALLDAGSALLGFYHDVTRLRRHAPDETEGPDR